MGTHPALAANRVVRDCYWCRDPWLVLDALISSRHGHRRIRAAATRRRARQAAQNGMRISTSLAGIVLILFGVAWILKGLGALPGNIITGPVPPIWWARLPILIGIVLLAGANARPRKPK
jgi:hypothetical protein